ncbi:hypothetical protein Hanom_Chr00s039064g01773581 [Helianthus anomalus]
MSFKKVFDRESKNLGDFAPKTHHRPYRRSNSASCEQMFHCLFMISTEHTSTVPIIHVPFLESVHCRQLVHTEPPYKNATLPGYPFTSTRTINSRNTNVSKH